MLSVALIGPDGAGKTTVGRQLESSFPFPVKYVYMGVNHESSNILLPSSRLVLAIRRAITAKNNGVRVAMEDNQTKGPSTGLRRLLSWVRSYLGLINLLAEECFRHALVCYYQRRGRLVVLDRWFYADYYTSERDDQRRWPLSKRIHSYMLRRVYPHPDLVIYLDAPAEVLFARKKETTVAALERRRGMYSELRAVVKDFIVVDAGQPRDMVVQNVSWLIYSFCKARGINETRRNAVIRGQ